MPNYALSKIYKLVSNMTSDIYIGSCLMRLSTRLSQHKNKSNSCVSKKLFVDNAIITIVLIENFACNTKNELKARELHYITTNNCININKPFVCEIPLCDRKAWHKEYKQANAEQINTKRKEYYQTHIEQAKEYYLANAEQISTKNKEYHKTHIEQAKQYYETHREQAKAYSDTNRDRINALQRARRVKKKLALSLQNNLNKNIIV